MQARDSNTCVMHYMTTKRSPLTQAQSREQVLHRRLVSNQGESIARGLRNNVHRIGADDMVGVKAKRVDWCWCLL